eukprot:TRINITY_DN34132_c0_g1_i1.p1 TRINITY_DN34132_c0_g1~~TRINITY_DN34132_c0_g1_i1.p1  ORF type:complete len:918 (+),score=218.73 TRINITY_DN34132_c0_g1_i1:34-2754(+)
MEAAAESQEVNFSIGQKVKVAGFLATVRFIGSTEFAPALWVGVELDAAIGKNDGSVQGVRYFTCDSSHGLFVRPSVVKLLDDGSDSSPPSPSSARRVFGGRGANIVGFDVRGYSKGASTGDHPSDDDVDEVPVHKTNSRRGGVSAEVHEEHAWERPQHEKTMQEQKQLMQVLLHSHDSKLKMLFGNLSNEGLQKVVEAMFVKNVKCDEAIIRLGDEEADFFYIVKTGKFDIFAPRKIQKADGDSSTSSPQLVKVFEAEPGFCFGEAALLYNAPRSGTIVATEDSSVWSLDRKSFRTLTTRSQKEKFDEYRDFLRRCDVFHELNEEQIASLAEVVGEEDFSDNEAILVQGERDNNMFVILRGEAVACIKGEQGEVEVKTYGAGDFFGEIALLMGEPRKASVYAKGNLTCILITKSIFDRVLGPLRDFLKNNMAKYEKYQEAIDHGGAMHVEEQEEKSPERRESKQVEVFDGSMAAAPARQKLVRKNDRAQTVVVKTQIPLAAEDDDEEEEKEESTSMTRVNTMAATQRPSGKPAQTLAERLEEDWGKPQLVAPAEAFRVAESKFTAFGGMRRGEKFKNDKLLVTRTEVPCERQDLEEVYRWAGPSWLKGQTMMSALCQKGQKAANDPTPNQDNYFALHVGGGIGLYGVCDGHGPFGHLVSFRLVQSLPHLLTTSPHWGKDWEKCLKEGFLAAQQDMLALASAEGINLEASGAACSVLVFEGPAIHVAHIGDAGCMVASWNRRDSRLLYGTEDHKPNSPGERERLEAAGSEVREVDVDSFRIYIPGTKFPGLTMSRAFGDTACGGVIQEPQYHQLFIQPEDEVYAIVASDGIWEFIDYAKAVDLTAKKLRLKGPRESLQYLLEASRKRWATYCEDYCDDITALMIQWNVVVKGSESTTNYEFSCRRPE